MLYDEEENLQFLNFKFNKNLHILNPFINIIKCICMYMQIPHKKNSAPFKCYPSTLITYIHIQYHSLYIFIIFCQKKKNEQNILYNCAAIRGANKTNNKNENLPNRKFKQKYVDWLLNFSYLKNHHIWKKVEKKVLFVNIVDTANYNNFCESNNKKGHIKNKNFFFTIWECVQAHTLTLNICMFTPKSK